MFFFFEILSYLQEPELNKICGLKKWIIHYLLHEQNDDTDFYDTDLFFFKL